VFTLYIFVPIVKLFIRHSLNMKQCLAKSCVRVNQLRCRLVPNCDDAIFFLQVMFFSTRIFRMAQLDEKNAQYATLGMGAVNVLMTVVSMFIVEKAGRKTLLLVGFAGMCCTTILLTICLAYVQVLNHCIAIEYEMYIDICTIHFYHDKCT